MWLGVNLLCATGFVNAAVQAIDYCDLLTHPAFGLAYDAFHVHIKEKDQVQAVTTLAWRIQVLHLSEDDCGNPESGQVDFPAVFGAVKKTAFGGRGVLEAFGSGMPELAAATRIRQPKFDDYNTLYSDSFRYLKDAWNPA